MLYQPFCNRGSIQMIFGMLLNILQNHLTVASSKNTCMMSSFVKLSRKILCVLMWKWSHSKFEQSGSLIYKWGACLQAKQWVGLHLLCLKFYLSFFQEFPKIFLLCLAYYSKIILKRYTCIRNKSFKIVESNEIKSLALASNCKQGTTWLLY